MRTDAFRPPLPQIHTRDRSPPPPPPGYSPTSPTLPQPADQPAQQEDEEVHEGDGQEVAERGEEQGLPGPTPVRQAVDVLLPVDVGASGQLVESREEGVGHPEENGVDGVEQAGGGGGKEQVEEDVDGVDGVEGHSDSPDLLVT